jgi:L-cysteine desulfidase
LGRWFVGEVVVAVVFINLEVPGVVCDWARHGCSCKVVGALGMKDV